MESHKHSSSLSAESAESTTSALDLTGTPTGLRNSRPSSPALATPDRSSNFARRRLSWGRVEPAHDPLRQSDMDSSSSSTANSETDPMTSTPPHHPRLVNRGEWGPIDDPFYSPDDDDPGMVDHFAFHSPLKQVRTAGYTTSQPGPSSTSLISYPPRNSETPIDDDEAHLTSNMSRPGTSNGWSQADEDPESVITPRTRRKTQLRYSTSPSPLKKTGTTLKAVSRNLRRISLRVVNLAGMGLEDHVRLADGGDAEKRVTKVVTEEEEGKEESEEGLPDLTNSLPIRGRSLGFLGPTNRLRLLMFKFLVYPWTEPCILLLIVINAIVLTIQAAHSIAFDPTTTPPGSRSEVTGYFHAWEDYVIFTLFVLFTLEMFARIAVSGFLLDPDIPTSYLFASPFSDDYDPTMPPSQSMGPHNSIGRYPSLHRSHSQRRVPEHLSFTQRLERLRHNFARPFSLAHHSMTAQSMTQGKQSRPRSDTIQSKTPMIEKAQQLHAHFRSPAHGSFLSKALKSDNPNEILSLPFQFSIQRSTSSTERNVPYLRQSWNRVDFLAVVGFWISFCLSMSNVEEGTYHIGIFRALSVLRTARLLAVTSGTTTIMRSLKTARPLLASVAYFVLFAMILFSIIGIQAFKGSFRRVCFLEPTQGEQEIQLTQPCGGYIDPTTLQIVGYLNPDNTNASPKGFACPLGQVCKEASQNPLTDLESFDTIYFAALQVFIVSTANGWSGLMYAMMDSEFFVSCFFFIVCIIILNFWLINLFVAVITNTFSAIRSETQKSAFGAAPVAHVINEDEEVSHMQIGQKSNIIKDIYENIRLCWVALALTSLVLQSTQTVDSSAEHERILDLGELCLTLAFDLEIIIRVLACLPDWRSFTYRGQNWLDLTLAIGSSIIQIPAIHRSSIYPWLTIFQLARFYRVILEIPRMKPLLLAVFGNMYGLANMSLFLLLINFITALVAVQLFRGDIPKGQFIDFGEIYNSFLAMYQIFSSENWTTVLYGTAQPEVGLRQSAITVLFLVGWMFFANFIIMQMFIAVINENFDVAEESKRSRQADHFWATQRPEKARAAWVRKLNPYRWFKASPKAIAVEQLPSNLVLPMQKAMVQDFTLPKKEAAKPQVKAQTSAAGPRHYTSKSLHMLQNLFVGEKTTMDVPLTKIRGGRRDSTVPQGPMEEEMERHLEVLASLNQEAENRDELDEVLGERKALKADFIRDHPTFDKTFWIFSQKNRLRRYCQKLVTPANSERIYGTPPSDIAHPMFQLLLLLTVVAGIVIETIATPIYRRDYYEQFGPIRGSWFDIAEAAFGFTLLLEFFIKIIADGFIFTPNAYVRSIWNILDLLILGGILVNITTGLIFIGGLSRLTRSLKALRALRLITLVEKMRATFESLIISGALRIMDAALLAILYMIPYAVWGLNIFQGLMYECNDQGNNISTITDCVNEYSVNPLDGSSFGYFVPRVWDNPAPSTVFSFDSFRSSLLILFEIVSLEGWIDVMSFAVSITGAGNQPSTNISQANSIFFLIYNLLGGVVILTLFVSIIIGNFTARTGTALLTQPQREWIDLQKLIKRQRPSKRPRAKPTNTVRGWCYDRASHKHGWWSRTMTGLFVLHVIALMTQTFNTVKAIENAQTAFFFTVAVIYVIDIIVRLIGLGWSSYSANGWNIFDIIVAGGSLITTLIVLLGANSFAITQLQKLFITSIAFKLVQRTNSLNKLFKTAVASLPVILSLLSLWLILFIFFAILFVEVFAMTKWHSAETRHQNYATVANALLMLSFMTTGEAWNQYMHDYAIEYPRCTINFGALLDSDCGSTAWAFSLFIAWNLMSMYIFANLFTGVVVESFNYVFQMTGGAMSITREEMRAFKKVWADCANPKTGYLESKDFVHFFGRLTGVFEVRIYPAEFSIPNLQARSKENEDTPWSRNIEGINMDTLDLDLNQIDRMAVKRRKHLYSRVYHEARNFHEHNKGLSFTNMLLLLAHHKLIVDREALVLKDLVVRNETNKFVTDLVDYDRVRSLLLMLSQRKRYLKKKEERRLQELVHQGLGIPAIVVDDSTSPLGTQDITSPPRNLSLHIPDPHSPSPMPAILTPELSFGLESNLQRSRRLSDVSMLSTDIGFKSSFDSSRDSHSMDEDAHNILASMQNSMWKEMMMEAAEEDD